MKSIPYQLFMWMVICVWGLPSRLIAQQTLADSLQSVIANPGTQEKAKPALLNQLSEIYRVNKHYANAMDIARQSAGIALRQQNYLAATQAYTLLANIKVNTQQYPDLKQTTDSVFTLAQQSNDPVAMAYAYYSRALLYKTLGKADEVVKFCQLGLTQLQKTTDHYIAAKIIYQLYAVNSGWNKEDKVYQYASEATGHALQAKDHNLLSNCFTALSVAHEYRYNTSKSNTELDSTLYYLKKTETLYSQHPGSVSANTYAIACINIANAYLKYFPANDNTAKTQAIKYANIAREVLRNAPNSEEVATSSLGILSEYARREGNTAQAEIYLLEAYHGLKAAPTPYYYTLINVTQALGNLYEQKGDYKRALELQKEVLLYNNKNFNEQQAFNRHSTPRNWKYNTRPKKKILKCNS